MHVAFEHHHVTPAGCLKIPVLHLHKLLVQPCISLLRGGIRLGRAQLERNKSLEGSALNLL